MKVAINACYGGWGLSRGARKALGVDEDFGTYNQVERTNKDLIALIESWGSERVSGFCSEILVTEIPDEATDWWIEDYDGWETISYVLNGKRVQP